MVSGIKGLRSARQLAAATAYSRQPVIPTMATVPAWRVTDKSPKPVSNNNYTGTRGIGSPEPDASQKAFVASL